MAFTVQNDDGTIAGANAYIEVAFFKEYHDDRGNSYAGKTDTDISKAIIKATDYIDRRFSFVGRKRSPPQTTQWPRSSARDRDGRAIPGIPQAVKQATAEYALRALSKSLLVDPTQTASGQTVLKMRDKIGPIETEVAYAAGGSYSLPKYPLADGLLSSAGILMYGRETVRA